MQKKRKDGFFHRIKSWEIHHKIIAFLLVMILTIIITRFLVLIHDPSPIIFNFELHHFDYGIILLLITCLLLLFGNNNYSLCLFMSAISIGLIVDGYWFIRTNYFVEPVAVKETMIYNSTWPQAVILAISLTLLLLLINHFKKKSLIRKDKK